MFRKCFFSKLSRQVQKFKDKALSAGSKETIRNSEVKEEVVES